MCCVFISRECTSGMRCGINYNDVLASSDSATMTKNSPSYHVFLYGFETHLRDVFFNFLPISFQMKNNDEMWL